MAASLGNFYIDAPTLATATAVFDDVDLTVCAADGFYSDGTTVREQFNCVLLAAQPCPSCGVACSDTITATGNTGVYNLSFDTGSDLGAMIVYFDPVGAPDGLRAIFDNVTYNEVTSPVYGYLASPNSGNYVVLGNSSSDCTPGVGVTLDGGGYTGLNLYQYNSVTSSFDLLSTTATVTGTSADVQLTTNIPGYCTMVIPRPNNNANSVLVDMVGFCTTAWNLEINCPAALTSTPISLGSVDCNITDFENLVFVAPNRGGTAGEPALNEFAFNDGNGVDKYPAGQYIINPPSGKKNITIDANGVITLFTAC
tara:strand:- start:24757 stop:25689 length:933 start_codon:yes stop_codon:yes gene_type:complete